MPRIHLKLRAVAAFVLLVAGPGTGMATADVVAVVSARGPETVMTTNQVVDIFLGRTSRFPDGRPAVPIDQAEGSVARDEFYFAYAGKSQAQLNAHWAKIVFTGRGQPPIEVANDLAVRKYLADHPGAIGYIERNLVDASVRVVVPR
jgi:ABC-type phosphate transport system substrate-binding protein